ncbi:hypothetical protein Aple_038500 [Acrocarpospora pleiomorpha]|uniref:Uncharacterized protein n=1 Tax=Acrocarpospora pleiomorpha TaxID=90975 RepID=A0A5M3XIA2_9ACTN|nr:hypothetical protein [Acrocarpospora pleiomorpha]GES20954.1 hypothetical protein Aple_038500 [Acrocarpospora pleiomorpha]
MSGNPARRAEQVAARQPRASAETAFLRTLAGGAAASWWPDSQNAVIEQAVALAADSPLELENSTAAIIGAEYWSRYQTEDSGFHSEKWLAALAALAADRLRVALQTGDAWQGLWQLLHGIAAMTPDTPVRQAITSAATALAKAGVAASWPTEIAQAEPAGDPLVATDGYGSRFAVLAPFAWGETDRHWYCWDVDWCGPEMVVAAGIHTSPEAALAEWRSAVGPSAADAEPLACDAAVAQDLLRSLTLVDAFTGLFIDVTTREFVSEQFRMRQRAFALLESSSVGAGRRHGLPDLDPLIDDFAAWLADRGGVQPAREDIGILADSWSTTAVPAYYACSPHRVEHAVILIADGYHTQYAEAALDLLPDWVEWCVERSGLTGTLADRARLAAKNNRWDGTESRDARHTE